MAAGRPRDVFTVEGEMAADRRSATSGYTFTPAVAAAFTNLGNCVTNAAGFETSTSGMMESMDEFFAGAEELPQTLGRDRPDHVRFRDPRHDRRDRVRADLSAVVGGLGQAAPHPGAARAARHVRQGDAVLPHPAQHALLQDLLPQGDRPRRPARPAARWRRASSSRARTSRSPDGTVKQTALFGTYVWSEDETSGDAREPALPRRDAVRRPGAHVHHRRARLSGHPRQRRPGRRLRGRAAGRRWRARSSATPTCSSTTRSRAASAACSATWAARPRTSCSASSRCRSRGARPAPGAPTSRPATTS